MLKIGLETEESRRAEICETILRKLPDWFGLEGAIVEYIKASRQMPMVAARFEGEVVGFACWHQHTEKSAEIHVMGVLPEYHNKGVGRKLIEQVEARLINLGARFLTVKTLSPSREDENYARTRGFYERMGFVGLEEFKTLWGEANPALMLAKPLKQPGALRHTEINVSDLDESEEFWGWLLERLGYRVIEEFHGGIVYGQGDSILRIVQAQHKFLDIPHHRSRVGMNHLAFHAQSRTQVDELTAALRHRGAPILYEDRHPFAGGENCYAVFFEDPDRIKIALIAP